MPRSLMLVTLAVLVMPAAFMPLVACEPMREEGALIDTRDNVLEQGQIDCTERSDTGYTSGTAFAITVVTVDGKPVEVATPPNAYYVMRKPPPRTACISRRQRLSHDGASRSISTAAT